MWAVLRLNVDLGRSHINPNAVAAWGGSTQSPLGIRVGNEICRLAGKGTPDSVACVKPWCHGRLWDVGEL